MSTQFRLLTAAATLGAVVLLRQSRKSRQRALVADSPRRLHRAAGTLAACVLLDSAIEHYRGLFHNRAMYAPLASALLTVGASAHGAAALESAASRGQRGRDLIYGLACATGVIGTAFHLYNIGKRTGGFSWLNFFYAAPVAAPAALAMAGVLGVAADRLHQSRQGAPRLLGVPAGRVLAALTSAGILGTSGEVGLLHFRGAFHNPAMYLPVTVPPVAAVMLARCAASKRAVPSQAARWWLRLTGALGLIGTLLHTYGVARAMGGWRNWSQNLLAGPPLPAPPSFAALAVSGLVALDLLRGDAK